LEIVASSDLPVTICDHIVIDAGGVVTKDITVPGFYVGNLARLLCTLADFVICQACR
jgi:UDP-3-O-[3-hydroxymyristoyl] glucosamine N-acyltransferase